MVRSLIIVGPHIKKAKSCQMPLMFNLHLGKLTLSKINISITSQLHYYYHYHFLTRYYYQDHHRYRYHYHTIPIIIIANVYVTLVSSFILLLLSLQCSLLSFISI